MIKWRNLFFYSLMVVSMVIALPNIFNLSSIPVPRINLGLDLSGGSRISYEVNKESMMMNVYSDEVGALREALRKNMVKYRDVRVSSDGIKFVAPNDMDVGILPKERMAWKEEGGVWVGRISDMDSLMSGLISKAEGVIRKRVDSGGTKEPDIRSMGSDRISIQLPGVDDPDAIKALVGKTAKLDFYLVLGVSKNNDGKGFVLPGEGGVFYTLDRSVHMSGDQLQDVHADFGEGQPIVSISMSSRGTEQFANITKNNIGKSLAIVLDGQVISAPNIKAALTDGKASISGNFTVQSAQDLAVLLQSGALPVDLVLIEEGTVGPSLGSDSIKSGIIATIVAVLAVFVVMFSAYGYFGAFANIGLIFNLMFLISVMAIAGITLTLPGIAALALSLAMAVDTNVLINESIKEKIGASQVEIAITSGYKQAIGTIMDSNITTLIGTAMLYYFGTGPVKGFAATLGLGIIVSLFTAISLTKFFIDTWMKKYAIRMRF